MAALAKRKKKIALITAVLMMGGGFAAYAYWTAGGSGTGTAETGTNVPITALQIGAPTAMAPGDSAQVLSGNFSNTNSGPVWVTTVTASISSVSAAGCTAADYTLANAVMPVGAEVPAGIGGAWTGASIKFNNRAVNQDACKGATVNLAYTIN